MGTYEFEITVTDSFENIATDVVIVNVYGIPDDFTTVIGNQTISAGDPADAPAIEIMLVSLVIIAVFYSQRRKR